MISSKKGIFRPPAASRPRGHLQVGMVPGPSDSIREAMRSGDGHDFVAPRDDIPVVLLGYRDASQWGAISIARVTDIDKAGDEGSGSYRWEERLKKVAKAKPQP